MINFDDLLKEMAEGFELLVMLGLDIEDKVASGELEHPWDFVSYGIMFSVGVILDPESAYEAMTDAESSGPSVPLEAGRDLFKKIREANSTISALEEDIGPEELEEVKRRVQALLALGNFEDAMEEMVKRINGSTVDKLTEMLKDMMNKKEE